MLGPAMRAFWSMSRMRLTVWYQSTMNSSREHFQDAPELGSVQISQMIFWPEVWARRTRSLTRLSHLVQLFFSPGKRPSNLMPSERVAMTVALRFLARG